VIYRGPLPPGNGFKFTPTKYGGPPQIYRTPVQNRAPLLTPKTFNPIVFPGNRKKKIHCKRGFPLLKDRPSPVSHKRFVKGKTTFFLKVCF